MSYSLTWLPSVLLNAGLKVAEVEGWQTRGHGDVGATFGILCHHTAGSRKGNMPTLNILVKGRSDLPGPLSQLGLGRDGTFYILAAGRCNHAGRGIWKGLVNGNSNFIGIEAENTGRADDFPWPDVQMEAYRRGVAAILKYLNRSEEFCAGHKEYALPAGRKPDANFDMHEFRSGVKAILNGTATPFKPIPAEEPLDSTSTQPSRPTIRRGAAGPHVEAVQKKLRLDVDGKFGPGTEAAVREFQRQHGVVPDGIIGPKSWKILDTIQV
ncbi:MAG: N-acetylmuramoyl-L-alanine amidase [Chitinophagaceae bacterium]|nr:MAG: N-acetylmuramoyl-L-alanine amidase [Chitinophagaceae bacterium]